MSGGHWDYIYHRVEEIANELNPTPKSIEEQEFGLLLQHVGKLLHTAEWAYSGDTDMSYFKKEWKEFKDKWLKTSKDTNWGS